MTTTKYMHFEEKMGQKLLEKKAFSTKRNAQGRLIKYVNIFNIIYVNRQCSEHKTNK